MPVKSETERLTAHLKAHACVCPDCGYCLDGLRRPVCPECGRGLSVMLLTRRRSARSAYVMGGIGLLFSFVMHGMILCVLLLFTTAEANFIGSLIDVGIGAAIFGLCMYLTFWWDDERGRLARRWAWAAALFVSPVWTSAPWIWIV